MPQLSAEEIRLFYVYDPMCSWCWGYRPTWLALQQAIKDQLPEIEVQHLLGGLAADSSEPMPEHMQTFLIQTWTKIATQLGTKFNFDFWDKCEPRRSTYAACRACIIARYFGLEEQMNLAIQQAYYLEAQNPSDNSTLIELADQLGLDKNEFSEQLSSPVIQLRLMVEIEKAHELPIQGYPSLVLSIGGKHHSIAIDYQRWESSFQKIKEVISQEP